MRVDVRGGDRFRAVAQKLRTAADRKELTRDLRAGILEAVPELKDAVREDAADFLPDAYAEELAAALQFRTNTTTTGDQVTVRITATAKGRGGNARAVGDVEAGTVRHPVHGRTRALKRHAQHRATSMKNPWVAQRVKPGFVTEPMTKRRLVVRKKIEQHVDQLLERIARG